MSRPANDQTQRDEALDPTRSFIVQAPAGSGKTELLTLRYMRLLALCSEPEEVLAITFTRKAASEMRDRIIKSLQQAHEHLESHDLATLLADNDKNPLKSELKRQNFRIANAVIEADKTHGWNLERHPGRLRIQTIDSFNIYLANQLPIASRVGGNLNVTTEVEPLFRAAIRQTLTLLEQSSKDSALVRTLFAHLDNNVESIESLLLSMLYKRDQWFDHLPSLLQDPDSAKRTLMAHIDELAEESLAIVQAALLPYAATLVELNNYSADNWPQDKGPAPTSLTALPAANADALSEWRNIARLLLTAEGNWRKTINKTQGFPAKSSVPADRQAHAVDMIARFKALVTELEEAAGVEAPALAQLTTLPSRESVVQQWPLLSSLAQTLRLLHRNLILEFTRQGVIDHTHAGSAALSALETVDGPTDLALALDNRLSHILIDEFQDTSERQLKLLEKLTEGWTPGDGRTLFVVGDAMQSCYNFRNANVGIYLKVRAEGVGDLSLEPLTLSMNFRSQEPLVEAINRVFEPAFPKREHISRGAVPYSHSNAGCESSGDTPLDATWITYADSSQKSDAQTQEATLIAQRVQAIRGEQPAASIAVLARNRNHFRAVVPAFRSAGIDWIATDIDRLGTLAIVGDLMTLLRALSNPADSIAWLALLRAPWCGLDSVDLLSVASYNRQESIWANMRALSASSETLEPTPNATLSSEGQLRLAGLTAALHYVMRARGLCTLRHLMECAWSLLEGELLISSAAEDASVAYFFSQVGDNERHCTIDDLDAFEAKIMASFVPNLPLAEQDSSVQPAAENAGSVHLLTMHKSKGLQYDYVIIPQLGGQGANDEKALITLHERLNTQNELRLLIAAVKRKGEQPTPESRANETLYDYIQGENKQKDLFEQTRLVYIAMTRAKRSVSLFATLNQKEKDDGELTQLKPNSRSLLARIWEPLQAAGIEGEIVITPTSTTQAENPDELPRVTPIKRLKRPLALAQDRTEILQAQFDSTTTAADTLIDGAAELQRRLRQQLGTLSHAFLEAYCLKPFDMTAALSAVIPRWQRQLQRQGASAALAKSLCARAGEDLIHCLKGEHAWLFASQDDAATELKLASLERRGNEEYHAHSVVDRTLVKDGVRWIIDFKTSQQTEGQSREEFIAAQSLEYQPQLDRYAALFKGFESLPQQRALFLVSINELVCL